MSDIVPIITPTKLLRMTMNKHNSKVATKENMFTKQNIVPIFGMTTCHFLPYIPFSDYEETYHHYDNNMIINIMKHRDGL